jgi:hypothetical protein
MQIDLTGCRNRESRYKKELENCINFMSTKITKKELLRRKDHPQRLIDILDLDVESIEDKFKEEYER